MENSGSDVALEVAGQKINLRNVKSLNTIATVLAFFGVCFLIYLIIQHQQETKDVYKELITIAKEQIASTREQTCLTKFPEPERRANSDFCKQVSGSR